MSFARAARLARYNAPRYALAVAVAVAGLLVALSSDVPSAFRWAAGGMAAAAAWFGGASFAAFHWIFDRSELVSWTWLARELDEPPRRWIQVSVVLEETTAPLEEIFPGSEGRTLDIYNRAAMPAPAIAEARRRRGSGPAPVAALDDLPAADGWADAAFVILAAHEIRTRSGRERLFLELSRILAGGGRLVLVEHLRTLAAALAFGPGMFHFLPRAEWLELAEGSGLCLERERSLTPFVHVLVFRKARGSAAAA